MEEIFKTNFPTASFLLDTNVRIMGGNNEIIQSVDFYPEYPSLNIVFELLKDSDEYNQYRITIYNIPLKELNKISDFSEKIRSRVIAFFVLYSLSDVSASEEIDIKLNAGEPVSFTKPGSKKDSRANCLARSLYFNKITFNNIKEYEWNALVAFSECLMTNSFANKFISLIQSVDVLGKNLFPNMRTTERIQKFMVQKLRIIEQDAKLVTSIRGNEIHENRFEGFDKVNLMKIFMNSKNELITYFQNKFSFSFLPEVDKMWYPDEFGIAYS